MSLFICNYEKPQTGRTLEQEFFDDIRTQLVAASNPCYRASASVEFQISNGEFDVWSAHNATGLIEHALEMTKLTLSHHKNPKKVGMAKIDFRTREHQSSEDWHFDGIKFGSVVADKNTTLFAHGFRPTIDCIHYRNQARKAEKIARSLKIFRAEPRQLTIFGPQALHTKPSEDLTDRVFIRTVLR